MVVQRRVSTEPYGGAASPERSRAADFSAVDREARTGRGYLVYPNGTIYEGDWQRGERHGLGVCYYDSGNIYVGQFVAGKMQGTGTMFFASGNFFTGEFQDSQIHRGVFSSDGEEIKGVWENGVRRSAEPVDIPENLRQAHVALFTTIVNRVHEHLRGYGADPCGITRRIVYSPLGAFLSPPADTYEPDMTLDFSQLPQHQRQPQGRQSRSGSGTAPHYAHVVSTRVTPDPAHTQPVFTAATPYAADNMSFASERHHGLAPSTYGDVDGPEKVDLRAVMTQPSSPEAMFVGTTPSCNEQFSLKRLEVRVFVFLFPFLSLPWVPFAPLRVTALDEEREFVVSGGTLSRDFDPPTFSIAVVAAAICCQIASIVIVACKVRLGRPQDGRLTLPEMVIPCVLWAVVALFCGSYNSYFHVPHPLERMNRQLTPKLTAFAASVVDSRSKVCIYTWDEEGRGKVRNRHYRYRWVVFSILFGAMMSLSAPATRGGMGHDMFGARGFEMAAALLAFFATFFFSTTLTYYVLKLTDMQREIRAKLGVLTTLAFIEKKSIANPSAHLKQPFEVDLPFDPTDLFHGFPGWYTARSIVLYSSSCSNHHSRSAAMSIFTLVIFFTSVVALSDVFKALAEDRLRSMTFYSTAHSHGFFVLLFWGALLARYFYSCAATDREMRSHQYIMDTVSLYHRVMLGDPLASETIQICRAMAVRYDSKPSFFHSELFPVLAVLVVLLNLAGMAAIAFQLGEAIYY